MAGIFTNGVGPLTTGELIRVPQDIEIELSSGEEALEITLDDGSAVLDMTITCE